jgi:hypothetical protein
MTRLAELLPAYDFNEVHVRWVEAPPERVYQAIKDVTAGEMPLVRLLFAIRSLPGKLTGKGQLPAAKHESLYAQMVGFGFTVLDEQPARELVLGIVDQAWKVDGGQTAAIRGRGDFLAFAVPGFIKAAMSFELAEQAGGTHVRTETRVQATDRSTRRKFGRYWRLIRPGSGAIRRSWLRAAKRRAEGGADVSGSR